MSSGSSDTTVLLILASILACVQFLYRIWDKKDNKLILDAMAVSHNSTLEVINANNTAVISSISSATDSIKPHIERGKRTFGLIQDLKNMHEVRDDDGRPLWYLPKELIETQRDLAKLTYQVAATQESILRITECQDARLATDHNKIEQLLNTHQEACKEQYHSLKEVVR